MSEDETPLYRLVEDHFHELERIWDERYERDYGFWRPVVRQVVEQFLDCGDLRCGFARIRCPKCQAEPLSRSAFLLTSRRPCNQRLGVRTELVQQVFYDSFFPLQSFAESASIGMADFDFEKIEAVLQEFPQILFFHVINI
jgi:hypothetical protein